MNALNNLHHVLSFLGRVKLAPIHIFNSLESYMYVKYINTLIIGHYFTNSIFMELVAVFS